MIEIVYSILGIQIIISVFIFMGVLIYNSLKEHFYKNKNDEIEKLKDEILDLKIKCDYYKDDE